MMEADNNKRIEYSEVDVLELPLADQTLLRQRYGEQLEVVRELNGLEKKFLAKDACFSKGMVRQSIYRLKCSSQLIPTTVQQKLLQLMQKNKFLRTCYYKSVSEKIYGVQQKVAISLATISFHRMFFYSEKDLFEKLYGIVVADLNQPVNYSDGFVPRIKFYCLDGTKYEYIVIITQPIMFEAIWKAELFLRLLLPEGECSVYQPMKDLNLRSASDGLDSDQEAKKFWQAYLKDAPENHVLPGYMSSSGSVHNYSLVRHSLDMTLVDALRQLLPEDTPQAWSALLSAAWALTVQQLSHSDDVTFMIRRYLPELQERRTDDNINQLMCMLPCRIQIDSSVEVRDFLQKQSEFLSDVEDMHLPNLKEYAEMAKQPAPRYMLCFSEFLPIDYMLSDGKSNPYLIYSDDVDRGYDFVLNFKFGQTKLDIDVIHSVLSIGEDSVGHLIDSFVDLLRKLPLFFNKTVGDLANSLNEQQDLELNRAQYMILSNLFKKTELFASVAPIQLIALAKTARVYKLRKYDVVQNLGQRQNKLLLVMSGDVIRQKKAQDGWLSPLNMVHGGDVINEASLFSPVASVYAEVVSDSAVIAAIPVDKFKELLDSANGVGQELLKRVIKNLEHYEGLWLTV